MITAFVLLFACLFALRLRRAYVRHAHRIGAPTLGGRVLQFLGCLAEEHADRRRHITRRW